MLRTLLHLILAGRPSLRLAKRFIHQFILATDHLLELAHRLVAAPRIRVVPHDPRIAQAFHHIPQLRQHLARCIARACPHKLADLLHHALYVRRLHDPHRRVEWHRLFGIRIVLQFLRQFPHKPVHGVLQLAHQLFPFCIGRVPGERLHQRILRACQFAFGVRELTVLDPQRRIPEQFADRRDRRVLFFMKQARPRHDQTKKDDGIILIGLRITGDVIDPVDNLTASFGLCRQPTALDDDLFRYRVVERAFR